MTEGELDRRVQRTKDALLKAFHELVLACPYDEISVPAIVERAGVGRSTFYEHYRSKDDMLEQSMGRLLSILADCVLPDCDVDQVRFVVEHFWTNRTLARSLCNGPASRRIVHSLAELVAERMAPIAEAAATGSPVPLRLAAAQVAEGLVGLLRAWLNGSETCASEVLADAMHKSASSATQGLFGHRER